MTETIRAELEEVTIATDVLVIGGGLTGIKAAAEIADAGYPVILIEKDAELGSHKVPKFLITMNKEELTSFLELEEKVKSNEHIRVWTQATLVDAVGVTGDFTVRISKNGDITEHKVGAIVVATEFSIEPLTEKYGLSPAENILSQSDLEDLVFNEKKKLLHKTVAFLVGFAQEGNPIVMERVLQSVLAIEEIEGCSAYVYVGNLKVAADGLERMFKAGREKGAVYFKLKEAPEIRENGKSISFRDPVLRDNMEILPDYLVVEESIHADQLNAVLAKVLRIDLGPWGFLQEDNVHLFPVQSNREGIYVIGASREYMNMPWAWTDVQNVALQIKELLGNGKRMVPKDKAVVDEHKCVICLTCYRCCPHGAIYWDSRAIISPVACLGCGICASECPMDAIQIGGYPDTAMAEAISSSMVSKNGDFRIVAFCCQNSAYEAGEMACVFHKNLSDGLRMIKVPCAGKIDLDYIMNSFVAGADGVLVMACHTGNCKSIRGNTFAGWRVNDALRMLKEAGLEQERLRFVTLASNMDNEFASIVSEMEEKIKELGASPMKG